MSMDEERSLGRIAQRHHEPHSCYGVDPIMGVGRRVFGMPQDGAECDAALLSDRLEDVNGAATVQRTEYRVSWKREGLRRKTRRFPYLPTAEKHVARLTDPDLDPHYRCADEGPHGYYANAGPDSEWIETCLPPIIEGPVIEERPVGPWSATRSGTPS